MSAQKPNILFILSDDQGAWSLGCAGNPDVKTPNLDRLANRGIRFENFFCASPVCSPARASIMTGTMPSQHGIHDWLAKGHLDEERLSPNMRAAFRASEREEKMEWPRSQLMGDRAVEYLEGQYCYPQRLKEAGYTCALFGKWHLGDAGKPQAGFDTWDTIAMGGDNYYTPTVMMPDGSYDMLDGVYLTDYITDHALDYLKKRQGETQPFYMSVHYTAPHAPWGRAFHPDWAFEPFEGHDFSSVPKLPVNPWSIYAHMSEEEWFRFRQTSLEGHCAAIYAMDRNIGRLMDELQRQGIERDTLVIFTADNGMSMGHHGIIGKGNGTFPLNMYEEAVKVPFIISRPDSVPEGVVESGLFGHVDLFPTLCDYLDCPLDEAVRSRQPGRSFAPVLRGEPCTDNEQIVICDEYGPVRMIRTRTWKYVHRHPYGPHELYHLEEDPKEEQNLAGKPEFRQIEQELRGRLEAHFLKYSDPEMDGRAEGVCGLGQTAPMGVRGRGKERFIQMDDGGKA